MFAYLFIDQQINKMFHDQLINTLLHMDIEMPCPLLL